MEATYTIDVSNNSSNSITSGWSTGTETTTHGTGCTYWSTYKCNCSYLWWPSYTFITYPQTIYKYQVSCPKCRTKNWGELEKIFSCKKCKSTIKLVSKSVDYEVEVN